MCKSPAETGLYYLRSRYYDPEIGRFINADTFASTGQGILGANMFAYCGNEPVDRSDMGGSIWQYTVISCETKEEKREEDAVDYITIIHYTAIIPNPYALYPDPTLEGTVEIKYKIDNRGVVILDTQQNLGGYLSSAEITEALATEMLAAATRQVPGALSGRTVSGVAQEIRSHYDASSLIRIKKLVLADMGGVIDPGYDYNARAFENPWNTPSVLWEMIVHHVPWDKVWSCIKDAFLVF